MCVTAWKMKCSSTKIVLESAVATPSFPNSVLAERLTQLRWHSMPKRDFSQSLTHEDFVRYCSRKKGLDLQHTDRHQYANIVCGLFLPPPPLTYPMNTNWRVSSLAQEDYIRNCSGWDLWSTACSSTLIHVWKGLPVLCLFFWWLENRLTGRYGFYLSTVQYWCSNTFKVVHTDKHQRSEGSGRLLHGFFICQWTENGISIFPERCLPRLIASDVGLRSLT